MRRWLAHFVFVLLCGALATILGTLVALTRTSAGNRLLAQAFSQESRRLVRGSIAVANVSGSFFEGLRLDSLVVRDTTGALLLSAPRVGLVYRLGEFLAGRVVLDHLDLTEPVIHLVKRRNGRMNYQEVLRLGEGPGGGAAQLFELHDLRIRDGTVEIRTPWDPPSELVTGSSKDSALAAERQKPGRRIEAGEDGMMRVRRVERLDALFPLLRISTPDRLPVRAVIEELSAWITDPGVSIREARGEVITAGDSLRFDIPRLALPASVLSGEGRLTWPADTVLFDFRVSAKEVALADLRWVSPEFPDFTGHGDMTALSRSGLQTEYDITNLAMHDDSSAVDGALVAITHRERGLGWRNLALTLHRLDLEVVRPYLDTLPFQGKLSGEVRANGFPGRLTIRTDWLFEDALVPGEPRSRVQLAGRVHMGGPAGFTFDSTSVPAADLDLGTVRRIAPAVRLDGRLALGGLLDGPWKNVTFWGTAEHRLEGLAPSVLVGRTRLDTRGEDIVLDADVELAPLMFEPLRASFPELTAQGALTGRVHLDGTLAALRVDADVLGAIGHVRARGGVTLVPPRWGADSLVLAVEDLNLAALLGRGEFTALKGTAEVSGVIDSVGPPEGRANIRLQESRIAEVLLAGALARGGTRDGLITVDTVAIAWDGGELDGAGTLGWAAPREGRLVLAGGSSRLTAFDSLLHRATGRALSDTGKHTLLDARVQGVAVVVGALDRFRATTQWQVTNVRWEEIAARQATALLYVDHDRRDVKALRFDGQIVVDSLAYGKLEYPVIEVFGTGRADSLGWGARAARGPLSPFGVTAAGVWQRNDGANRITFDALNVALTRTQWELEHDATLIVTDSLFEIGHAKLVATDQSGSLDLAGSVPRTAPGELEVHATGIQLQDVYGVMLRDTSAVDGLVSVDGALMGTAAAPVLRGTGTITGPVFGDFHAPLARGAFYYNERQLSANLTFWRTGAPVLEVDGTVPMDLALAQRDTRQLPGELAIRARTDSVNLGVLEAFTPNLRRVRGNLAANVTVLGSWEAPRLGGEVRVRDGALDVPDLGVGYGPINGLIHFAGDSVLVDTLRIGSSEGGVLDVGGGIQLERLNRTALALDLVSERFLVMDLPDLMRLRATASLQLQGSVLRPVLTGSARATNSVVYFSNLVTKNIVNLEDPLNKDLVDTVALREGRLGAGFQSRFLDSLRIQRLNVRAGEDVWLRSGEANIQLEGAVVVDKVGRRGYRIDGTLNAPRGTYTLKLPLVTKEFVVERGAVRYFGTPDLNAELDLEARHLVRSVDARAEDLPIIAHITGTLRAPQLQLETPSRLPYSQSDLAAFLIFGTTDVRRAGSQQFALEALTGALTSEISRTIIANQSQGVPDLFEIRPGVVQPSGTLRGLTQVVAGWQIGTRWFVTFNAGFCPGGQDLSYRNFGASLEYHFHRDLWVQASAEPVQFCGTSQVDLRNRSRYQFGTDLRWDRDY